MRGISRAAVSVATAGLTILAVATPFATAHEETALYALAVIDEVSPDVAGLEVRVAQLTAPVVIVANRTDDPLVIHGTSGEPFLRIAGGRVEANLRSPTAYRSADPTGERPLPAKLEPGEPPRWTLLARKSSWSWFDPRVAYRRGALNEWTIPGRLGDQSVTISGDFEAIRGHGHFRTELDAAPRMPGLDIRMFDGSVPGMFARNTTGRALAIPGRQGEPFLEIGPDGVFGNTRSPDLYLSGGLTVRKVPAIADPDAPPRWERLSSEPVWSWLEYRARLPASAGQRARLGTQPHTVLSWITPMTLGSDRLQVEGHVEWVPPHTEAAAAQGAAVQRWGLALLVALILGGVTTLVLWRFPRRAKHPEDLTRDLDGDPFASGGHAGTFDPR
ncbi:MAG: hypothetical protein ACRDLB_06530 [Actinomycetota bacterium]